MTPKMRYNGTRRRIDAQLKLLATRLQEHAAKQASDTTNWGFVGDLDHIEVSLHEILEGFGGAA